KATPDGEILNVLCWGSVTEPAILVRHLESAGQAEMLKRVRFIAHWTNSSFHMGTLENPATPPNCNEDAAACAFLKRRAKAGVIAYHECGGIGQHGIVSGGPTGDEYFNQFKISELGRLFVEGKYVRGRVDHSDAATYWALLSGYGVNLQDLPADGSNPPRVELRNEKAFKKNSRKIHDELLRRARAAADR
ncbi:MAG: dehydrogenase, partial [Planctomycetota bacterium]